MTGAGAELKHLLNDVKSKTSKAEILDPKPESGGAETIESKPKRKSKKVKTIEPKPNGDIEKTLDQKDEGIEKKAETIDSKALGVAIKGANSNKQSIAVWSPEGSAMLWYLKKTIPEFSISDEARQILEKGLQEKYPELYGRVKKEMGQIP